MLIPGCADTSEREATTWCAVSTGLSHCGDQGSSVSVRTGVANITASTLSKAEDALGTKRGCLQGAGCGQGHWHSACSCRAQAEAEALRTTLAANPLI
eukprot:3477873-Rhodomonas_salina.1